MSQWKVMHINVELLDYVTNYCFAVKVIMKMKNKLSMVMSKFKKVIVSFNKIEEFFFKTWNLLLL